MRTIFLVIKKHYKISKIRLILRQTLVFVLILTCMRIFLYELHSYPNRHHMVINKGNMKLRITNWKRNNFRISPIFLRQILFFQSTRYIRHFLHLKFFH